MSEITKFKSFNDWYYEGQMSQLDCA